VTTDSNLAAPALDLSESRRLHEEALRYLPMGVTGDGRYSEPFPISFARGHGKRLEDVDGNVYLDYHGGFGTAILGYSHPVVDGSVRRATEEIGAFVGLPHPGEVALAERLTRLIPLAERVALCGGGGSDAIYHAVRVARAHTGRTKIVKVEGGYHGWHADVGVSTRPAHVDLAQARPVGRSNSAGSLQAAVDAIVVVTVNHGEGLEQAFAEHADEIAGVILEPVLYSAGCIHVEQEYIDTARSLCAGSGALLIYDEVMSGFRNGLGGAGARKGPADLGVYGKAIANGYIIAVLAGRADLIGLLAPEGPVFYSGTFNGHPLSVAAAHATLDVLETEEVIDRISALGERLAAGVNETISELGLNAVCQTEGSVWNLYFGTRSVREYRDLARALTPEVEQLNDAYLAFLREHGVYVHKRYVNRAFVSAEHDEADIDRTVEIVREFLQARRQQLAA
jgi:glutamate-1-semialdehyde 2,1-aminomutase